MLRIFKNNKSHPDKVHTESKPAINPGSDIKFMSIDVGTQSIRAMVFDSRGKTICKVRHLVPPFYYLEPGWAELPADLIWQLFCKVTNEVAAKLGEEMFDVKACAITTIRNNIIAVDAEGNYLRDWILWIDQRLCPEALEDAMRTWNPVEKAIYKIKKPLFDIALLRSKFNWLKYHEPETWHKTYKYLTVGGLLNLKLLDKYIDCHGLQAGVLPYEVKRRDYYKLPIIYKAVGCRRDQFVDDLVDTGECMGYVTAQAAKLTGLPEGLPIVAGGGDKQCESIGSGVFDADQAVISYGTMAALAINTPKCYEDSNFQFYTFTSGIPTYFTEEYLVDRGFWLITWFCRQYADKKHHPRLLEKFNELAASIPAGSNGLFLFPFWNSPNSVKFPEARGTLIGWTDLHTPAHIYRAILESVAYNLRSGKEYLEKKTNHKLKGLTVVGGGSYSDVAMQLTADIFNLPVTRMYREEVGTIGAGILAGVYAGVFANLKEATETMCEVAKVFYPNPSAVAVYERIYTKVFLPMYKQNLSFYRELKWVSDQSAFPDWIMRKDELLANDTLGSDAADQQMNILEFFKLIQPAVDMAEEEGYE